MKGNIRWNVTSLTENGHDRKSAERAASEITAKDGKLLPMHGWFFGCDRRLIGVGQWRGGILS
jgi:hypothetical protein